MLLTIVVLTMDNLCELQDTVSSIKLQDLVPGLPIPVALEILIVDSSQNELPAEALSLSQADHLQALFCRDFPPRGIFPAMNLALNASKGDWIIFLNSGDSFFNPTALVRLLRCCLEFRSHTGSFPLAVFGQALICPNLRSRCKPWLVPDPSVHSIRRWLNFYYPNHQSLLVDGSWARAHPFQTDAPQSADRVWMRAALSDPQRVAYLAEPVVRFSLGGVSSGLPDWPTLKVRLREPTRTWGEKLSEVIKFALRPWAGHYPRLMALRSNLIGRLV